MRTDQLSISTGAMKKYFLQLDAAASWNLIYTDREAKWIDRFGNVLKLNPNHKSSNFQIKFTTSTDKSLICPDNSINSRKLEAWGVRWSSKYNFSFQDISSFEHELKCELFDTDNIKHVYLQLWHLLIPIYLFYVSQGGLPFHAALIQQADRGYIFCGNSGAGKSTISKNVPAGWESLCEDELLISPDGDRAYKANPFPTWSNFVNNTVISVSPGISYFTSFKTIFILKQAKNNSILSIDNHTKAAMFLYYSVSPVFWRFVWGLDKVNRAAIHAKMLENAAAIAQKIPCYILNFTHECNFWDEIPDLQN